VVPSARPRPASPPPGELRSLDALHLAAALLLPRADLTVATWDRRVHQAVSAQGVSLLPKRLP
jgi:predicted nucleic acid-binding protein